MTAVVSKYYKGISAERRKKEFFKAVGFEPRQVKFQSMGAIPLEIRYSLVLENGFEPKNPL